MCVARCGHFTRLGATYNVSKANALTGPRVQQRSVVSASCMLTLCPVPHLAEHSEEEAKYKWRLGCSFSLRGVSLHRKCPYLVTPQSLLSCLVFLQLALVDYSLPVYQGATFHFVLSTLATRIRSVALAHFYVGQSHPAECTPPLLGFTSFLHKRKP